MVVQFCEFIGRGVDIDFSQVIENLTGSLEDARKDVHEVNGSLLMVQSSLEETQLTLHDKELLLIQQQEKLEDKSEQLNTSLQQVGRGWWWRSEKR